MVYREIKQDIFVVSEDYCLAHCISADFGMGAGIAVLFNKHFNMKKTLKAKYPNYLSTFKKSEAKAGCIREGRVFNLITKERVYQKPTYDSLHLSLEMLKAQMITNQLTKLAIPKIGCGIDRLEWNKVSEIILNTFQNTDIEILVCCLE